MLTVLGQPISTLTLHQAGFLVWIIVIGLHVLARFLPAVHLATGSTRPGLRLPGRGGRVAVLVTVVVLSAAVAAVGLALAQV